MSTPLSSARGEIQIDVSGVKRSVDSAVSTLNQMKSGVMSVAGVMGGAFLAGTTALAGGLAAVAVSGVKMAQDLQAQMSSIQAVMGATNEEIAALEDQIVELGLDPNLKVSTQEAAAAIEMLGLNGLTTKEILDGAARSTVLLSNATGGDFAQSASIATDVMALFKIEAADMGTAVDGITSVVTNSKFSINDYALALAQGGGVAATAGVSFSDFNTTIAAISPLFASGSDAGTSFKTAIMRLAAPTDKARAEMDRLGLSFYDAEGNMKSMADISAMLNEALYGTSEVMVEVGGRTAEQNAELQRLQGAYADTQQKIRDYELGILGAGMSESARAAKIAELTASLGVMEGSMSPLLAITGDLTTATRQLSEEERTAALTTIFGSDAMRAMAGLAQSGAIAYETAAEAAEALGVSIDRVTGFAEGGITEYEALMISMGMTSAADAAATRMDNLAGSLEILQGVIDAVKIKIGQAFLGVLKQAVDVVTGFLNANGDRFVAFFETAAGVIESFIDSMQSGGDILGGITVAIQNLTPNPELRQRILEISNAIRDLIEKAVLFVRDHAEEFKGALIGIGVVLAGATVLGAIITVGGAIATLFNPITLIIAAAAAIGAAWAGNWLGIKDKTQEVIDFVRPYVEGAIAGIRAFWAENGDGILTRVQEIWGGIRSAIATAVDIVRLIAGGAINGIRSFWEENGASILATVQSTWGTVQATITTVITAVSETLGQLGERIRPGIDMLGEFAEQIISAFHSGGIKGAVQQFIDLWPAIKTVIMGTVSNIVSWLSSKFGTDFTGVFGRARTIIQTAWDGIKAIVSSAVTTLGPSVRNLIDGFSGAFQSFAPIGQSFKDLWLALQPVITTVVTIIGAALVGLVGIVVGVFQGIIDAINPLITTLGFVLNGVITFVTGVIEFFTGLFQSIWGLITGNSQLVQEGWAKMGQGITNIVMGIVEAVGGLLAGLWETIKALVGGIVDGVITFFTNLYNTLVGHSIIPDMVNAIITWIASLKDQFIALIFTLALNIVNKFIELKTNVIERVLELKNEAANKFDEMKSAITDKIELLKIAAAYKFLLIKTAVTDKLVEMKEAAIEKVLLLKDSLTNKFEEIKTAIAAKVALFVQVGRDLMSGLKDGAAEMAADLIDAVVGPINDAIAAAKALLGIESPSKVFRNFGVQTFTGYILAARQMAGRVKTAVTDALTPALSQAQRLATQPLPNVTGAPLPALAGVAGQGGAVSNSSHQTVNHYHINGLVVQADSKSTGKSLLQEISDRTIGGGGGQSY